jgi:ubiquinone/menaquinone biosynthesis C-methylase UbiE
MDTAEPDLWRKDQQLIDEQFDLQVRISYALHHAFMQKHGLAECHEVLDLGTGNGCFLSKIANDHPKIHFYGVDNKPIYIDEAMKSVANNVDWIVGDVNELEQLPISTSIDGILMRYFILHLPNIKEVLSQVSRIIRSGTALWIFDLDLDRFYCSPQHRGFDLIKDLVKRYCAMNSIDTDAATRMPDLLTETGFDLMEEETEPFSNKDIETELFIQFLSREVYLYNELLVDRLNSQDAEVIRDFIQNEVSNEECTVRYGMVMMAARKARS